MKSWLRATRLRLLDNALFIKALEITDNKVLYDRLQYELPKFVTSLVARVKEQDKNKDRDR